MLSSGAGQRGLLRPTHSVAAITTTTPSPTLPSTPQVISACRSLAINTCHDCIFYLGVNQPPLLLGDNRFLQLAPHNSGYERLAAHMALAGVRPAPNQWDQPLALLPDHSKHHHGQLPSDAAPGSPMQQWQAAALQREQQAAAAQREQGDGAGAQPASPTMHQQVEPMELSQQAQQQQQGQQGQQGQQQQAGTAAAETPPSTHALAAAAAPATPASPTGSGAGGSPGAGGHLTEEGLPASPVLGAPAAVTVLPPAKLMPFVVPFKGGPGPMCGGPAAISLGIRCV